MFTTLTHTSTATCDGAATYVSEDNQFIVVDCQLNWPDANAYCYNTFGTTLATSLSLDDDEQMLDICELAINQNEDLSDYFYLCWFGLNDITSEGIYMWIESGQTINDTGYSNWHEFEPTDDDTVTSHDCGLVGEFFLDMPPSGDVKWFDVTCSDPHPFICNFDGGSTGNDPTRAPTEEPTEPVATVAP